MIQTGKPIRIINVPLDLGASRRGTDAGPSAFRVAGLKQAILSLGYSDVKETDVSIPSMETVPPGDSSARYKDQILAACTQLAEHTRDALEAGEWPLVIGGDHSIAMGTVSGVSAHMSPKDGKLGVIWFDAHGDMNLPRPRRPVTCTACRSRTCSAMAIRNCPAFWVCIRRSARRTSS